MATDCCIFVYDVPLPSKPLVVTGLNAPLAGCPPDALVFARRINKLELFDRSLTAKEIVLLNNGG